MGTYSLPSYRLAHRMFNMSYSSLLLNPHIQVSLHFLRSFGINPKRALMFLLSELSYSLLFSDFRRETEVKKKELVLKRVYDKLQKDLEKGKINPSRFHDVLKGLESLSSYFYSKMEIKYDILTSLFFNNFDISKFLKKSSLNRDLQVHIFDSEP